jgi:hypothetical protein
MEWIGTTLVWGSVLDGCDHNGWISEWRHPVATENLIRAGTDAAMGYPRAGMTDILTLLGTSLVGRFCQVWRHRNNY